MPSLNQFHESLKRDRTRNDDLIRIIDAALSQGADGARTADSADAIIAMIEASLGPQRANEAAPAIRSSWPLFAGETSSRSTSWRRWLRDNAALIVVVVISAAVLFLIGRAIFDQKFLNSLSSADFARGWITYLFALSAIAIFFICTVAVFGKDDEEGEATFRRSKDILASILGIFGTILGFYFGSTTGEETPSLSLATPTVEPAEPNAGERVVLSTFVQGGRAPYRYVLTLFDPQGKIDQRRSSSGDSSNGLIVPVFEAPTTTGSELQQVRYQLSVVDAEGIGSRIQEGTITVKSTEQ